MVYRYLLYSVGRLFNRRFVTKVMLLNSRTRTRVHSIRKRAQVLKINNKAKVRSYVDTALFGWRDPCSFFRFPSKKMRLSLIRNIHNTPAISTLTSRISPSIARCISTFPFGRAVTPSTHIPRLIGPQIGVYHFHSYSHRQTSSIKEQVPVQLAYDVVEPSNPFPEAVGQSLVICHGLLYVPYPIPCSEILSWFCLYSGSKQNWRSLAKAFAVKLGMPVYTLVYHAPYAPKNRV